MKPPSITHAMIVILWVLLCSARTTAGEAAQPELPDLAAAEAAPDVAISGQGSKVTLQAAGANLVDLIRMLAEQAQLNVVIDPDVRGSVTASLTDVTLEQAMQLILQTNGYAMRRQGDVLRVLKAELVADSPESRRFKLTSVPVTEVVEQLKLFLTSNGKIVSHPQNNSLVVVDTPDVIADVEEFLKSVDVREQQVTIKAELVEVSFDKRDQFGFEWRWLDTSMLSISDITGTVTQTLLPPEADSFHVALGNEHFTSAFEALITDERVNLLSAPRITTVNNQEATVEITEDIPYVEATTTIESQAAGGSTTSTESVEFVTVGVKLSVLPQIGEDGRIRMKIAPEVSEAPTRFNNIPVVTRRKAETTLIVENGQTIVLGGLIRENVTNEENRVPLLGSIPLLGALFRSTDKHVTKVELYIFITPYINDGAFIAGDVKASRDSISAKQQKNR